MILHITSVQKVKHHVTQVFVTHSSWASFKTSGICLTVTVNQIKLTENMDRHTCKHPALWEVFIIIIQMSGANLSPSSTHRHAQRHRWAHQHQEWSNVANANTRHRGVGRQTATGETDTAGMWDGEGQRGRRGLCDREDRLWEWEINNAINNLGRSHLSSRRRQLVREMNGLSLLSLCHGWGH